MRFCFYARLVEVLDVAIIKALKNAVVVFRACYVHLILGALLYRLLFEIDDAKMWAKHFSRQILTDYVRL